MDILTIAIRNNKTIIGKFKKKKKTFEVNDVIPHKSLMPLLTAANAELLNAQIKYMIDGMDAKDAVIYVTMPSGLCRQDCWQSDAKFVDHTKLTNWIETLLQNEIKEDYAVGLPIVQRYEKKLYVSGAGIKKSYIDSLYNAFKAANADIAAIEAESVSYVRAIARWGSNYLLANIDEKETNITAYCAKIGMYTTTIPIGAVEAQSNEKKCRDLITEIEFAAATWDFQDQEAPKKIFITGEECSELIIRRMRLAHENIYPITLPKMKNIEEFNRNLLVLPIGTAYRNFYEKGSKADADPNYEFFTAGSGDRTSVSAYKEKIQKYFDVSRLRAYFSRNR